MKVQTWETMPWEKVTPEISRKIITGGKEMIALVHLEKGAFVPEHSHLSEQIIYILEGSLKLCAGGEEFIINAGQVLVVPPNLPHAGLALEKTLDLDIFSPIRQDWLDHTDNYFQGGLTDKK
jgi:quercetin dioxygenase-like cupin family protein